MGAVVLNGVFADGAIDMDAQLAGVKRAFKSPFCLKSEWPVGETRVPPAARTSVMVSRACS